MPGRRTIRSASITALMAWPCPHPPRHRGHAEQGGFLLSYEDLAFRLFNCGLRTIVRDVKDLRSRDIAVPTRSANNRISAPAIPTASRPCDSTSRASNQRPA